MVDWPITQDIFHVNVVLDICSKAGAWALSLASAVRTAGSLSLDAISVAAANQKPNS